MEGPKHSGKNEQESMTWLLQERRYKRAVLSALGLNIPEQQWQIKTTTTTIPLGRSLRVAANYEKSGQEPLYQRNKENEKRKRTGRKTSHSQTPAFLKSRVKTRARTGGLVAAAAVLEQAMMRCVG